MIRLYALHNFDVNHVAARESLSRAHVGVLTGNEGNAPELVFNNALVLNGLANFRMVGPTRQMDNRAALSLGLPVIRRG